MQIEHPTIKSKPEPKPKPKKGGKKKKLSSTTLEFNFNVEYAFKITVRFSVLCLRDPPKSIKLNA